MREPYLAEMAPDHVDERAGARPPQRSSAPPAGGLHAAAGNRAVVRLLAGGGPLPAPGATTAFRHAATLGAGNRAAVRLLADVGPGPAAAGSRGSDVATAFRHATSGAASTVPHLPQMERAFGTGFADVRAYVGGDGARTGLTALGAVAASYGNQVAFADSAPSVGVVAHELAHVVQARTGGGGSDHPTAVSSPGDSAEASAHAAADCVVQGRPLPDLAHADDVVHRAVATNGGSFDTTTYTPTSAPTGAVGERLGAHILLEFTPNDLVESTKIGMIQTVKAMKSSAPGGARDTVATGVGDPEEGQLIMGPGQADPGREIDRAVHPGGRDQPNTSPVYGVHNTAASTATALAHGTPTTGSSRWGSHTKDPATGAFLPAVTARIDDAPGRVIEFAGQTFEHTFEATAVAVEGPMPVDTYLGSVSWGWRSDAAGTATVDPLTIVQAGAPSSAFMGAAQRWNAATFHDTGTGAAATPVGVPVTTMDSGTVAAVNRTTSDLLMRLPVVDTQIVAARLLGPAGATDLVNKEFEKRALEAELRTRNVKVAVHVISTEDLIGSDSVYVRLTGPAGGTARSPVRDLNDGDSHDFMMPVAALLPLTGPVGVKVFDHDWPDADDEIVDMTFAAPWVATRNASSKDGAKYEVTVTFER